MAFPRRLFVLIIPSGRRACAPPIRQGYRDRRERQAQGDAGHVCAEAMEKVMPPAQTGARKQLRELLKSYATILQAAPCSGFCSARARLI